MKYTPLIVVVGDIQSTISEVVECIVSDVSRTAPLTPPIMPGIVIEARPKIEFPDFDVRPLREKPRRDWEQRNAPRGRRR